MFGMGEESFGEALAKLFAPKVYSDPIGPTQSGSPLPSEQVKGPLGGIDFSLAGPILQGLGGGQKASPQAPAVPHGRGAQLDFGQMLSPTNPASIRQRLTQQG